MSGFNKPSRLAPQGSGKNHESSKDSSPSSSEQSTSNAKPGGGAAKPGGKKLQWSMGDLLNKLENPETPLAAAKASVDVNSTPGSTPQTRTAPPLSSPAPDAAKENFPKSQLSRKSPFNRQNQALSQPRNQKKSRRQNQHSRLHQVV